jgi:hypothetical protein
MRPRVEKRVCNGKAVRAVEAFITSYDGDDLLHDIELAFPDLTYRDFFVAFLTVSRSRGHVAE